MSPVNREEQAVTLRPYQNHTVAMNLAAHQGKRRPTGDGVSNCTANVLATGLGKTVIFADLAARYRAKRQRTLVLVHREELADQARRKLHTAMPGASIGIVKAERNEWERDIVIASVPSLARESQRQRRGIPANRFGLGIADEMHHSAADSWRSVMDYFGAFRGMPWAGFTATLDRNDGRGLGEIWQETVAEYDISFGVREGYLVRPHGRRIRIKDLMLDEVRRSRGDFQDDDLGQAMEDADAGAAIAKAYLEHCPGKRAALFTPTKSSARRWADDLNEAGIPTEVVLGETTTAERNAIYERFRIGTTLVISSCMVITEGWDAPWAEVAIMARPTKSASLYIQCVGRVLRPWAPGGKTGALVLDVVGVTKEHGLASLNNLALDREDGDPREYLDDPDEETSDLGPAFPEELRQYNGEELVAEEVDLFQESDSAWLKTTPGLWFVPTRESYYYLWPKGDGSFGLGKKLIKAGKGHGVVLENDLTLEGGMAWAERYARDDDQSISSRSASWRKRRPSDAMLKFAAGLRIPSDGLNQGQLGDLITIAKASQSLPAPKAMV